MLIHPVTVWPGAVSPSTRITNRAGQDIETALREMERLLGHEHSHGFLVPATTSISLADIFAITVSSRSIRSGEVVGCSDYVGRSCAGAGQSR